MESRLDIFKKFETKSPATKKKIRTYVKGMVKAAGYRQIDDDIINNEIVNIYRVWQHDA